MKRTPPASLNAARVVLWTMAALLLVSALAVALLAGGALGVGLALPHTLTALLCAGCAFALPRMGRRGLIGACVLLGFVAFTQMARMFQGEAMGIVGAAIAVTALVLLLTPASRRYLRGRSAGE
ncbi:hypothetical protein CLV63_101154 [Murinocardiopsis flavida]|uniref:Uncharacterized protein n=1 Tax=Murinocardiopsis flavida TaxID=645275 RepID=A0A2P8DTX7_9ACTN|nr:hypothetical protein [Murinocardiopsis flavida]PSL00680.1 hypothetical protein CLV63_101154 [Murinocardiopsis flavida]